MSCIRQMSWIAIGAALLLLSLSPPEAQAHGVRPAYLEIHEQTLGRFDIVWNVPVVKGARLGITPALPPHCSNLTPSSSYPVPNAVLERWTV